MVEADPARRRAWIVGGIGSALVVLIVALGLAWSHEDPWTRSGDTIAVSGWAPYWQTTEALASFRTNSSVFGDVSIMAYSAEGADRVTPFPNLPDDAVAGLRSAATDAGVPFLVTIFDQMPAGGMATVLADPTSRTMHVTAITAIVVDGGFDGVDLDYEQFAFADGRATWAVTRPNWITFLSELAVSLHERGKRLVVSVPGIYDDGSETDRGYWVYDHAAMGTIVDRIRIMAYDYSIAEPGPIAPIDWVREVVHAVAALVPVSKLDLGIPVYGRDWPVSISGTCPADQAPGPKSISTAAAAALAGARGLTPAWDASVQEMRFDYLEVRSGTDPSGAATSCTVTRTVRYLDATAIQVRAQLAWRSDLHGVALWALGNDDPATWLALQAARQGLGPIATERVGGTTTMV
jgi:spore germination protein YaaH